MAYGDIKADTMTFSDTNKGAFSGLESIIYRLDSSESLTVAAGLVAVGSVSASWEIADDVTPESQLGASSIVTETSDIFTFGSTGYWSVRHYLYIAESGAGDTRVMSIIDSENSSFAVAARTSNLCHNSQYSMLSSEVLLKITATGTQRVRFRMQTFNQTVGILGNTAENQTYAVFTKLANNV